MKKFILIFILILNIISARTIVLATDPFPPFHSPEVKGYGFFAEIVQAAFKEVGHDLKIEFVPWNRALVLSQTGYYDGVIGALYSDDRAKNYLFSNTVYKMGLSIFINKNNKFTKNDLENKKNLRLGRVRGYYYPEGNSFVKNHSILESSTLENSLGALLNNRLDFIIEANTVINYLLNEKFKNNKDKIVELDILNYQEYKILISKKAKDSEEILTDFNSGLDKIRGNGVYNKILKKYKVK